MELYQQPNYRGEHCSPRCFWCCTFTVLPLPVQDDDMLELYYRKGFCLYWEPIDQNWYILFHNPCKHLIATGCKIYKYRPKLCQTELCLWPNWMWDRANILLKAGQNILHHKFGGAYETNNFSNDKC